MNSDVSQLVVGLAVICVLTGLYFLVPEFFLVLGVIGIVAVSTFVWLSVVYGAARVMYHLWVWFR